MSKTKRILDDSFLKKACTKNKNNAISENSLDSVMKDVDRIIDEEIIKKNLSAKRVEPVRKTRRTSRIITSTVAIAACTVICAVAIVGGVTKLVDPISQNTDPSTINSGQASTPRSDENPAEETTSTTVKEREVEIAPDDPGGVNTGEIVMTGGKDKKNYTNPTKIVLKNSDMNASTSKWTIKDYKTEEQIHSGTGTTVTKQLAEMIKNKQNGSYYITFDYENKEGHNITIYDAFVIKVATEK